MNLLRLHHSMQVLSLKILFSLLLTFAVPSHKLLAVEEPSAIAKVQKMNHCEESSDCQPTYWEEQRGKICPTQCKAEGLLIHKSEVQNFKKLVPEKGAPKGCDELHVCNPLPPELVANRPVPGCVKGRCQMIPRRK